jgi:hypothetical protein
MVNSTPHGVSGLGLGLMLAIMVLIGFGSYFTLKLLFSRVTVLPQV